MPHVQKAPPGEAPLGSGWHRAVLRGGWGEPWPRGGREPTLAGPLCGVSPPQLQSRTQGQEQRSQNFIQERPARGPSAPGTAPLGVGGRGTGRAGSPRPMAAPRETRGEGSRAGRACTTPQASAPPNQALSPGRCWGPVPWLLAPRRRRRAMAAAGSAGAWGQPPRQHSLPGALPPLVVTAKPRWPRGRGSLAAPAHCSTQTSLSSSSPPAASPSSSGTAGTSSTATTFSRSSISRSRLSLSGRLLR